ncbi:MAG: hemerythrin domain-containing protein [Immundisolibacteraceae bacterium]|nr:hemerythrin domain-containing protein [Immundisolibacteraceae bacterium]
MDIYERIIKDHRMQRDLAGSILKTEGDSEKRQRLWNDFKPEAVAHANAEEQTFYAALIEDPDAQEQARHSISEHKEADDLIEELSEMDMSSGGWLQKFKKLKKELDHHMDEEEKEVFNEARRVFEEGQAQQLAQAFSGRKEDELKEV